MTREEWLNLMTSKLRPRFQELGYPLPEKLRVSCGFPSKSPLGRRRTTVGECWASKCSADQTSEIFITPLYEDAFKVAEVLVHELGHAADDCEHHHTGTFRKACQAVGLEKAANSWKTTKAGEHLTCLLSKLIAECGLYPHRAIVNAMKLKKQGTRMLKVICPDTGCGYTVRTTQQWIDVGLPTCPCGKKMKLVDKDAGGGDEDGD